MPAQALVMSQRPERLQVGRVGMVSPLSLSPSVEATAVRPPSDVLWLSRWSNGAKRIPLEVRS
jgi:hypothetical protein